MSSPKLAKYSDTRNNREFVKGQIFGTIPAVTPQNIDRPKILDRTIIITGANSGLGLDAAKQFVALSCVSRLILACRNPAKAERAKQEILYTLPEAKKAGIDIRTWELDMARKSSVMAFVQRAEKELDRIDAIVLNAGVDFGAEYVKAAPEEGSYEMTLQVNVIATMMLAVLILPVLRKKARELTPRITIVGSAVQFFVKYQFLVDAAHNETGESILEWLSNERRWKDRITEDRYFLSKGILQMMVQRMTTDMATGNKAGKDVIVNCVAPGYCRTELFRTSATAMSKLALTLIGRDSDVGARCSVVGAVGKTGGVESHGMYMSEGVVKGSGSEWFKTEQGREIGKRIWDEVCEIIRSSAGSDAIQL